MQKSESIKELATALNAAQKEIAAAKLNSENPYFKSKYADLASVWGACRDALSKNGLAVSQLTKSEGDLIGVETVLMHRSGEWLSETLLLKPTKTDPQAAGSALSYARRYALSAIVGVVQEDDDANTHSSANAGSSQTKPQASQSAPKEEIYTGTTDQQKRSELFLKNKSIPQDMWLTIHNELMNKPTSSIYTIVDRLKGKGASQ